ncbi:hypothetical protein SNE40_017039 [Patella caerulea]|uniref:Uncharacterized protein n=1 Tax=Patella caerulea TaxID=87958 RepID=A0AAN8P924_PATCE
MSSLVNILVLFVLGLFQLTDGMYTREKLTVNVPLKAGEKLRVPFDETIYDSEHNFHPETSTVDITKKWRYYIEAHVSISGLEPGKNAGVKVQREDKNGVTTTLKECHTNDENVRRNVCKMDTKTPIDAGDKIYVEVLAESDAEITPAETYIFLSELHMDYVSK